MGRIRTNNGAYPSIRSGLSNHTRAPIRMRRFEIRAKSFPLLLAAILCALLPFSYSSHHPRSHNTTATPLETSTLVNQSAVADSAGLCDGAFCDGKCCRAFGRELCCNLRDAICCDDDSLYCCPQAYPYCDRGECTNSVLSFVTAVTRR